MEKKDLLNRIFLIIVFVIFELVLLYEIQIFYDGETNRVLDQNLKKVETQYKTINKSLNNLADSTFIGFIDRPEIKEAFKQRDRKKLYNLLNETYMYLTSLGFRQVHFHLPDNTSFLRMHKPEKYGDNLSSFRYTVEYVNRYKKSIHGLETGRVLPGMRNVYPIFFGEEYLGSVEMSFGIDKVENEIEKVYTNIYTHFLIKKDKFNKTVFDEYKIYYKDSFENNQYVQLKRVVNKVFFKDIDFEKEFVDDIKRKMDEKEIFNFDLPLGHSPKSKIEHKHYVVSFLPISNVKSDNTMYFVFYESNNILKVIEEHRLNKKIIFSMLLIGMFLFIFQLMRNREITLRAKKHIEKEKAKYKDLMSIASDGIHILDIHGNIYEANKSFAKMLGYSCSEIKSLNVRDFDYKFSGKEIPERINALLDTSQVFNTLHIKKDKTILEVQISAKKVEIDGDIYLYASSRDITKERNEYRKLEKFIELQDNIVIITNSKQLTFANKKFFEFSGFKSLEDFNKKFECICDLFVENDRFFHLGKVEQKEDWIKNIESLPHSKRVVGMLMYDYNLHAFAVTVNKFEEDLYILSFTDITQTMLNHIELEDKTIHDKLTNAYNREYFEQNIPDIIKSFISDGFSLGVAFLDIDHFKRVNDTFGHDVGDDVLIHFVKTIQKYSRENDILIRWGGEEFILFLRVNSNEGLKKALEHLRRVIELEKIPVVGKITCSIGASIYKEDENIYQTIKRADEAVYVAKNKGRNAVEIN
ncbi:diguanylate cyclase [Halarcobacter sp.]|uniref:sensor domain-containing diguanylate cyclase n=1 Tax=Halarcobacter sp. TaxID=2321133 RepID=UPI0029F54940|nr:diguanylate cyclase [Halarcobacter sp.]